MDKYRFVFKHDRVGRLVDAQEFRRLRFPKARFAPELLEELLREAALTCRIEGDDLIVEHCYLERRMKPLNVYLQQRGRRLGAPRHPRLRPGDPRSRARATCSPATCCSRTSASRATAA